MDQRNGLASFVQVPLIFGEKAFCGFIPQKHRQGRGNKVWEIMSFSNYAENRKYLT